MLDVMRLAVRNAAINDHLCAKSEGDELWTLLERHLVPSALPANQMLTVRITCNMMSHPCGEALVISKRHQLLAALRQLASNKANKTLQVPTAFCIQNCFRIKNETVNLSVIVEI